MIPRLILLLGLARSAAAENFCKGLRFDSLNPGRGAPGEIVEFHGAWGPEAPFKQVVFNLYGVNEAEVLEWQPRLLRVKVPAGRPGTHRVGVYCHWGSSGLSSSFKDFEMLPAKTPTPAATSRRMPCTDLPSGLSAPERASALTGAVQSLWMAGRIPEGEACAREAIAAHKAAGSGEGLAHAYLHHYYFANSLGREGEAYQDLQESARLYRRAIAAAPENERGPARGGYANTLVWLVQKLIRLGRLAEAQRLAEEKHALHRALNDRGGGLAVAEQTLGEVALAQGRHDEAVRRFAAAASRYKESGNRIGVVTYTARAKATRERAALRARLGPVEAADPAAAPRPQPELRERRAAKARPAPRDPRSSLALLRFALTVYAAERGGAAPETLQSLEAEGYIAALPRPLLAEHPDPPPETSYAGPPHAGDTGGWGYDARSGRVFIDCTHRGPEGRYADW